MTAIALSAPGGARTATRLRLTQRGRRLLAALAALPAVVALALAIIGGGAAMAARDAVPASSFETVTVLEGDSLWSIAQDVAPDADPRDVVDAFVRLNALGGVTLTPGQELAIPAAYAPAH
ncbi:LysM peptidoglycan-binding domain-containing protein [Microbacterium ulmi]|uniref:LysM peptidoglycan-binding domain-containing protein n=1 Tax=Microbacterium ulmi TaxID=179095 RepID=A0A7Y2M1M3_9MICO|nr:LysM peptidoglycan-binding domain-containing protein [Microbacterium ulmi]NII70625.1 Tfp pilus assembly protein FimV [Microbacterium ulmi]NNH04134.1 LysM peptidoglycan-binding domain-containing protein [Microbacterium ulmi]